MSSESIHMLFVNDNLYITNLDVKSYNQLGIKVDFCSNIQVIMEKIKDPKLNLILLSLDYSGYDVYKLIYLINKELRGALPIVVTGIATNSIVEKKLTKAGATLFVEQPIPKEFLIEKIKNILNIQTRKSERVNLNILSNSLFVFENKEISCVVENISKEGLLVSLDNKIKLEEDVLVSFKILLEVDKPVIEFIAKSVRIEKPEDVNDNKIRIGFEFESFISDAKKRLKNFLKDKSKELEILKYYS